MEIEYFPGFWLTNPMPRPEKYQDEDKVRKRLGAVSASLVAWIFCCDQSQVTRWAAIGMPRKKNGSFDVAAVSAWFKREGRHLHRTEKPAAAPGSSPGAESYPDMEAKYKALARKQEYERELGKLIPRIDAEREYLRIVLSLRAALLSVPEQIASQVANLGPREVAMALRERMHWICSQHQDGFVAVPQALEDAVDKLVTEYHSAQAVPA